MRRFLKNRAAIAGLMLIFILIFISIFGYLLVLDQSIDANHQTISLRLQLPNTKIKFIVLGNKIETKTLSELFFGRKSTLVEEPCDSFYQANGVMNYRKLNQPYWNQTGQRYQIIERRYWLGTDNLGRDVLSRLIIGTRISLLVGIVSVFISLFLGSILGLLGGYFGGFIDRTIMWLISVFWAIPTILLAMVLLAGFRGESKFQIWVVFLAVGLTMWVDTARLVRGLVIQLKERPFVEATKALGFDHTRIIFRHIFPNTFSSLIVITMSNFASAILIESGLSYMGLGVQPPTPSWGSMLREFYNYIGTEVSYLALFPGFFIMLSVLAFYSFGNGLRDAMDIRY